MTEADRDKLLILMATTITEPYEPESYERLRDHVKDIKQRENAMEYQQSGRRRHPHPDVPY